MKIENDEPDWSLLPSDPLGFFGLEQSFDRSVLKRRYGQLIRRFKPETSPVEFQRIRSAFEELENWLQYRPAEQPQEQLNGWTTISADRIVSPTDALPHPIHLRLRQEQPERLYQELSARQEKSPADYFALAILSDIIPSAPKDQFAVWVLEGLDVNRDSNALRYLLHFYLRGPIPSDSLPILLTRAAQHLPEHYYFPLTDRHWIELLKNYGFQRLRDTLAECERHQPSKDIANRVIFYLHILRHAIWEADPAWVQQTISFVEEHFRYIPAGLDSEIDLMLELQKYTSVRATFIERHPLRIEMDTILRTYIADGEVPGDQALHVLQTKLLEEPDIIGEAFPDFDEPTLRQFYSLWAWVSLDSAKRNVGEITRVPIDPVWNEAGRRLTRRAQNLANWSTFALKWRLKKLGTTLLMVVGFVAIPILLTCVSIMFSILLPRQQQEGAIAMTGVASVVGGIYLAYRFWVFADRRWIAPLDENYWPTCYRLLWQPVVLQFQKRTLLPVEDVMRLITTTSFLTVRERLNKFIERDYALAFYSLAQRFIV
jgi:hypothetical protein